MLNRHGRNEIVIPVPTFIRAAVRSIPWRSSRGGWFQGMEYFNYFYIYQLCAVWLTVYWDYVTYGLLLALLATASGLLKVPRGRKAH